jgi:4-aminobutyrate aminotransferase-like enzyme
MARAKMVCPITKGVCTECPIYRGRHFYLCFAKAYHGVSLDAEQIDQLKAQYKSKGNNGQDKTFGIPDAISKSTKWLHNVEELAEREEANKD